MTPTEKAKELVYKYKDYLINNEAHCAIGVEKDLATICVDELISLNIRFNGRHIENNLNEINYWMSVKEEIQKL